MLVAAAAGASAQPPLAIPPVPAPPAAQPAVLNTPQPTPAPVPSRVVLFQKPADDAQPSGKTEKLTKPPEKPDDQPTPPAATPPGGRPRQEVSRLESDEQLLRRITEELKAEERERRKDEPDWRQPPAEYFQVPPVEQLVPAGTPHVTKPIREGYPAMRSLTEPDYVVHRRLYFEEKNSERYGWDLGIVQPVVSTLYFYKDTLLWPAKIASNPHERYDTSAGKCLPGSPVPYYLYPPEVDLWGVAAQAAIVTGVAVILP